MKNYIKTFLIILLFTCVQNQLSAYTYTFSNHTNDPILVGVKLCCLLEDTVIKLIKPHKMTTFTHGKEFAASKFGYCLQSIVAANNITESDMEEPETAPFKDMTVKWIRTETFESIMDFAESLGASAEKTGKLIAEVALGSATAGSLSSTAVTAALNKQANKQNKSSGSNLIKKFGNVVSMSFCRDRHFDIYKDKYGELVFICKIGQ